MRLRTDYRTGSSIQTAFIDCDVSSLPGTRSKPAGKTDLTGRFVHLPRSRLPTVSRYRFSLSLGRQRSRTRGK